MIDVHRIVIIGSGFGGMYAYKELCDILGNRSNVDITIISPTGHFVFSPLLHEVATGNLPFQSIITPVHSIEPSHVRRMVRGTAKSVDLDSQIVTVDLADNTTGDDDSIPYDSLIIGVGADTNFFGVKGANEYSYVLKSINDARKIKDAVIRRFEEASDMVENEDIAKHLRVAIIGGGPTGVELAGELSDMMVNELRRAYPYASHNSSIVLIDGGSNILGVLDEWFQQKAEDILTRKGNVSILTGIPVASVHHNGVVVGDSFIECGMVIWTGGVRGADLSLSGNNNVIIDERSQRIAVEPSLNIKEYPSVFVIGDKALLIDPTTEKPYPQRAQFAVQQGQCAARNIVSLMEGKKLESFKGSDKGIIISMGSGDALASVNGMKLKGKLAWFTYRTVYLFKLFGWRNRVRTGIEWALNLVTPRDISRER